MLHLFHQSALYYRVIMHIYLPCMAEGGSCNRYFAKNNDRYCVLSLTIPLPSLVQISSKPEKINTKAYMKYNS